MTSTWLISLIRSVDNSCWGIRVLILIFCRRTSILICNQWYATVVLGRHDMMNPDRSSAFPLRWKQTWGSPLPIRHPNLDLFYVNLNWNHLQEIRHLGRSLAFLLWLWQVNVVPENLKSTFSFIFYWVLLNTTFLEILAFTCRKKFSKQTFNLLQWDLQ